VWAMWSWPSPTKKHHLEFLRLAEEPPFKHHQIFRRSLLLSFQRKREAIWPLQSQHGFPFSRE
jgi:hypothetical protein